MYVYTLYIKTISSCDIKIKIKKNKSQKTQDKKCGDTKNLFALRGIRHLGVRVSAVYERGRV